MGKVVEILKIEFEKMHFFLYFVKYDFIVGVALCLVENSCKEKFIQSPNLFDIRKQNDRLLLGDNLFAKEGRLEVRCHRTEISNVSLLRLD